ncbi:MAG: SMP-30/gluconolactonase/LRE family protein [Spirochaetota bacterium]
MKKYFLVPVIISFMILTMLCCGKSSGFKVTQEWATGAVLDVPESVIYNAVKNEIYVSNINGKPLDKDGNGYISKLSLDGKIVQKKWITGFHAPKGMAIIDNTLYVTDIDRVHTIDIKKGEIVKTYNAPEAEFLNDIDLDASGVVYISDMKTGEIYILENETLSVWVKLDYKSPNGLYLSNGRLLVGTSSGIVAVDTRTKEVAPLHPHDRSIDGLKPLGKNSYIVSDWDGKVEIIGKNSQVLVDKSDEKINAADFEFISGMKLLLVPTFFDNQVVAYLLK